jgi:hypothetical protein
MKQFAFTHLIISALVLCACGASHPTNFSSSASYKSNNQLPLEPGKVTSTAVFNKIFSVYVERTEYVEPPKVPAPNDPTKEPLLGAPPILPIPVPPTITTKVRVHVSGLGSFDGTEGEAPLVLHYDVSVDVDSACLKALVNSMAQSLSATVIGSFQNHSPPVFQPTPSHQLVDAEILKLDKCE